jgi:hypothetical protein
MTAPTRRLYFTGGPLAGTWRDVPGNRLMIPMSAYEPMIWDLSHNEVEDPTDLPAFVIGEYVSARQSDGMGNIRTVMRWTGEERTFWSTSRHINGDAQKVLLEGLKVVDVLKRVNVDLERNAQWWLPSGLWRNTTAMFGIPVRYRADLPAGEPILTFHVLPSSWRFENRPDIAATVEAGGS